jgi:hypothetical protein
MREVVPSIKVELVDLCGFLNEVQDLFIALVVKLF